MSTKKKMFLFAVICLVVLSLYSFCYHLGAAPKLYFLCGFLTFSFGTPLAVEPTCSTGLNMFKDSGGTGVRVCVSVCLSWDWVGVSWISDMRMFLTSQSRSVHTPEGEPALTKPRIQF